MTIIQGDENNNVLTGTPGNNLIQGFGGDDELFGRDGNDFLKGGDGNDLLRGNQGNDLLDGGDGNDRLGGSSGNDLILGGDGNDSLFGGDGNDFLFGGDDNDLILIGPGHDIIIGSSGADTFVVDSDRPFKADDFGTNSILDFESSIDKITLSTFTFTILTPTGGPIDSDEFEVVATDADAAASEAFITYSTSTGNLFYNKNGINPDLGAGGQFATLQGIPDLNATDFIVTDFSS